jgi:spermidine/putrescine ABC transporter ATP-binding subunit
VASPAAGHLRVAGLRKVYGDTQAVRGIDLEVAQGEFLTLLGPSGCGKTTTLRLVAGFETPDSGRIELHGTDITRHPPHRRPVNTVFQHYALFPHMSVGENVAFGLRMRGVAAEERRRRVEEALAAVALRGLERRRPRELSGGQQQRVALARALVNRPEILLLDEPLGALDLKLRRQMQVELKSLHREVGITFVYVTHDQEEALAMSDRVAVMRSGRIEQIGAPQEIYERPRSRFVADFIGDTNLLEGVASGRRGDLLEVRAADVLWRVRGDAAAGSRVALSIRPERWRCADAGGDAFNTVEGTVIESVYSGSSARQVVALSSGTQVVVAKPGSAESEPPGALVRLRVDPDHVVVLPAEAEENA